ncbi:MAG: hypothetical protein QXQ02_03685 [Halobacteria archaeon]
MQGIIGVCCLYLALVGIQNTNPTKVTHLLDLGQGVKIGVSRLGGGYINYATIENTMNIVAGGYGRGWQSSIRDAFHRNAYNPTQAGFDDGAGAIVNLQGDSNYLQIPSFRMPLFSSPDFDFTEHEDISADAFPADGGNTDMDGIWERYLHQFDEIASEFDFKGQYQVVSQEFGIPALRHRFVYIYARLPQQIRQFRSIVDNGARVLDKFPLTATQEQVLRNDLSVVTLSYGIRFNGSARYNFLMWIENGEWSIVDMSTPSTDKYKILVHENENLKSLIPITSDKYLGGNLSEFVGTAPRFVIIADSPDPNAANAWGIYIPEEENELQINATEDRRIRTYFFGKHLKVGNRATKQVNGALLEQELTALIFREHLVSLVFGESVSMDIIILQGTPVTIREAIELYEGGSDGNTLLSVKSTY